MRTGNKFQRSLLIATLLMCSPSAAAPTVVRLDGSTISEAQIDATVGQLMAAAHVPGVGIAIVNSGRLVFLKAYGYRDVSRRLPLTPDSVMTAASLTKGAFAAMVLQLAQEHIVDLDKPVAQYLPKPLPDYPGYSDLSVDSRYKSITLRMLLDHTSGLPNWRRFTDDGKLRIYFQPGSRFAYSGEGIDLAQMVVETVTGKPVEALMQERVFGPLAMTRSRMVWQTRFENDYANGYDEQGKSLGPERRRHSDSAGSMQTTLHDYALLLGSLLNDQTRGATTEIMLSPQIRIRSKREFPSLAEETTTENDAIRLSYGLGWGLYWTPYGKAFFKEGHDEGWRNYVVGFTNSRSGILIMTNSSNGEDIYSGLIEAVQHNSFTPLVWEGFKPNPLH